MKNIIEKIYYPYYYLFFRLYRFNEVLFNKPKGDNWPLVGGVSSFQIMNILSIIFVYGSHVKYKFLKVDDPFNYVIPFSILGINALIFLWKGRDKKIIAIFENETLKQKNMGIIFTWIYIIGSYAFLFYSLSLN